MATRTVLIIDDSPSDIEVITQALGKCQECVYNVTVASSHTEGLRNASCAKYDCVLLDLFLSDGSGVEFYCKIKEKIGNTPILLLTGPSSDKLSEEFIESGAQNSIKKFTITSVTLHQKINEAIHKSFTDLQNSKSTPTCKVLIVDDNIDDIALCTRLLKDVSIKYTFEYATSGKQGLEVMPSFKPDCVLLDYSMPGASGLDVLIHIVNEYPFTPVILMTGYGNESIAVSAIKKGAENYLIKGSLESKSLDKTVKIAVQKKQLEQRLAEREKALAAKQEELIDSFNFQSLMQSSMPGYIYVKDSDNRIVRANQQFLNLYPQKVQNTIIGQSTLEYFREQDKLAFQEKDKETFDKGYSESTNKITFPGGKTLILRTIKTRFEDTKGRTFLLGVATDVTQREYLIEQLEKSNADLEEFAYMASHDLKSPLHAIHKLVCWIQEDYGQNIPEGALHHFEMIKKRSSRLITLLNDLLEYSRLSKKLGEYEQINLTDFVQAIHALNEKAEFFELYVSPINVELPKTALQIVLMNLLNNSIKHHDKTRGSVRVEVGVVLGGYEINYFDDGPGIPDEFETKIFQMFTTLKSKDEVEGSGMGLAMTKKIIDYYNGSISLVKSKQKRRGVHFKLFWPIARTGNVGKAEEVAL